MGVRFRKTINVIPGVKLNLSKSGISTSIGSPGSTVNFSKHGVRTTLGIPGTGISYTTSSSRRRTSSSGGMPQTIAQARVYPYKQKGKAMAWCLSVLGPFGAHRYYAGRIKTGLLYTFTFGLFTIGWFVDIVRLFKDSFCDKNGVPMENKVMRDKLNLPEKEPFRVSIPKALILLAVWGVLLLVNQALRTTIAEVDSRVELIGNVLYYMAFPSLVSFFYLFCRKA